MSSPLVVSSTLEAAVALDRNSQFAESYQFPRHLLPASMKDDTKIPLVIVACGSFSPITYLHLRMFEMAKDHFEQGNQYELLAGYFSPVSDAYMKDGLAPAKHRVKMCQLAVDSTSDWMMVDSWESRQDSYQRTAVVLDHFDQELNRPTQGQGGVLARDGSRKHIRIMLLAGGDLIASFGHPGVWTSADLHHIVGDFGCVIVERTGTDVYGFLLSHDILYQHRMNVLVIKQLIHNDISSTKIRLFVKRGMSITYLLPDPLIDYIKEHNLYRQT
ncbi:Nucleotidylyl transferase [Hesseltinella vesiculosa]|uniref:Nicotinamide-nucleotide adenylyltransferase n=1 Tax=Hesseltinella vesiculosa TaxID=101127 RepID=A0A1X2GBD1_9FUNG|nr:Nucleotidylyl transferase [Hesseltinella vesiculosa]